RKVRQIRDLTGQRIRRELIGRSAVEIDTLPVVLHPGALRQECQLAVERLPVDAESARKRSAGLVARRPVHTVLAVDQHGIARVGQEVARIELARIERAPALAGRIEQAIDDAWRAE